MTIFWRFALWVLVSGSAFSVQANESLQSVDSIVALVRTELLRVADAAALERAEVEVRLPDERLRLQSCPETELKARVANTSRLPGRVSVEVSCEAAQRWKIYVPATLATRIEIPVPRWNIPRNQEITQADLETRELVLTEPLTGIIDRQELALGKLASRFLNAGEPIRLSYLSAPLLVKRGQMVTIRYQVGQIQLMASGTAQADGHMNDWIRVRNSNSGTLVEGRVGADGSVLVASENP